MPAGHVQEGLPELAILKDTHNIANREDHMVERPSRIQFLRTQELEKDELKLIEDIEEYGCHVIQVWEENGISGWSYTVGLYEMLHQPEIIVVGLQEGTAHVLLNEVARRLKDGVLIQDGVRQAELLSKVDCEFKTIDSRWIRQTMGYAVWFYDGDEFPVLQCVYPDLENKLPWEDGFDETWGERQPLLFSPNDSAVERDFWAANDPDSSLCAWKFPDPPHTGVYTTKRISNGEEPILYVWHEPEDGAWQFHGASESSVESGALVCFHHLVDKDPSLKELQDLPTGWRAWRESATEPWVRQESEPESE